MPDKKTQTTTAKKSESATKTPAAAKAPHDETAALKRRIAKLEARVDNLVSNLGGHLGVNVEA